MNSGYKLPAGYGKGGRKNGTLIHPSSQKPGSGSGNLYKQQSKVGPIVKK